MQRNMFAKLALLLVVGAALVLAGCASDGEMGPAGPMGATGPAGPPGADGADGMDGAAGADGMDGADGTDGMDGADGTDGMDGADGTDGMDGADGTDGMDGAAGADGMAGVDSDPAAVALMVKRDIIRTFAINKIVELAGMNADNVELEYAARHVLRYLATTHDGSATSVSAATTYVTGLPATNVLRSRIRTMLDAQPNSLTNAQAAMMVAADVYDLYGPSAVSDANVNVVLIAALMPPGADPEGAAMAALDQLHERLVHDAVQASVAGMNTTTVARLETAVRAAFRAYGATLPTAATLQARILSFLGDAPLNPADITTAGLTAAAKAKMVADTVKMVVAELLIDYPVMTGSTQVAKALGATTAPASTPTETPTETPTDTPMDAEEMLAAIAANADARVGTSSSTLSSDLRDYSTALLAGVKSSTSNGIDVLSGTALGGFGGIASPTNFKALVTPNGASMVFSDDAAPTYVAFGEPGPRPSVSGVWTGAMEGYLVDTTNGSEIEGAAVSGRARILVDVMANGTANADVAMSELTMGGDPLDHVWPSSTEDTATAWSNIEIGGTTGAFSRGDLTAVTVEDAISGQFYGSGASEVGGVFKSVGTDDDTITGVFAGDR